MSLQRLLQGLAELLGKLIALKGTGATPSVNEPPWLRSARAEIGFRERGVNLGIEHYIQLAHCGELGDPWCALFVNAMLELNGIRGTRSALARSFEHHPNFVKLEQPSPGAIVTMWRGNPYSGQGHVFFYTGEYGHNVWGIAGNEDDAVRNAPHDWPRITGYWWPRGYPLPKTGPVRVSANGQQSSKEV